MGLWGKAPHDHGGASPAWTAVIVLGRGKGEGELLKFSTSRLQIASVYLAFAKRYLYTLLFNEFPLD